MAQLFRPGANAVAGVVIVAIVLAPVAAVGLTYAYWLSPYATRQYIVPRQPVPFSHEHHVGRLGLDCRYCHTSVEQAAFAGIPPTHICMTCHSQIWTNAAVLQPVRDSLAQHQPLSWVRVNRVPDYVYFDHSIHIAKGVGCTTCHGPIGSMPLTYRAEPLTMGWCLSCHRHPEQFVRPREHVFDPEWHTPPDQGTEGAKLVQQYLIHTSGLTDCSRCHR
jgi:Cytochrome c7 and related cytochrome c